RFSRSQAQPKGPATGNKICQFKLVLLGESSLVLCFVKGQFHEYQESIIGETFLTQTVCLDYTTVKFEIWDTAGQEWYHSLGEWVKELQRQASPNIVIALSGNKEAQAYADGNSLLFMETSAKTAMNVNEIFMAGLELLPSSNPPALASQSARITGVSHHARPLYFVLYVFFNV
uniref:Uncharacterized protein n=1 Tax=Prolemur simus TaxID=1328070 RepID=A0A8C8ZJV0_PROSS